MHLISGITSHAELVRHGHNVRFTAVSLLRVLPLHGECTLPNDMNSPNIFSMVIALFWLGWTVSHSISPIVPALSGFLFYLGLQLVFIGMGNFLTDVFRQHSASANAAAGMTRSIGAVLLPLAASPMYDSLGIHWAPSLLGFLALLMGLIPFVFIKYGDALQKKSRAANATFL